MLFEFTKIRVESFNSYVYFLSVSFFGVLLQFNTILIFLKRETDNFALFGYSLDAADIGASSSDSAGCVAPKLSHPALMPCHKLTISASETAI